jgi:hypothetical protein
MQDVFALLPDSQETAMIVKKLAAAAIGLCLTWGAYAGPEIQDSQPQAASPAEVPPNIGGTSDVIILELGPAVGGTGSAEEQMAMQMLLLQLLMMQAEMGAGGEIPTTAPMAPGLTGI